MVTSIGAESQDCNISGRERLNHERQDLLGERQLPLAAAPLGEDRDVAQARLRDQLLLLKGPEHRPLCQAQPSGLNTFFSSSRSHTLRGHSPPGPTPAGRPQAAPAHPPKASLWSLFSSRPAGGTGALHLKELREARLGRPP